MAFDPSTMSFAATPFKPTFLGQLAGAGQMYSAHLLQARQRDMDAAQVEAAAAHDPTLNAALKDKNSSAYRAFLHMYRRVPTVPALSEEAQFGQALNALKMKMLPMMSGLLPGMGGAAPAASPPPQPGAAPPSLTLPSFGPATPAAPASPASPAPTGAGSEPEGITPEDQRAAALSIFGPMLGMSDSPTEYTHLVGALVPQERESRWQHREAIKIREAQQEEARRWHSSEEEARTITGMEHEWDSLVNSKFQPEQRPELIDQLRALQQRARSAGLQDKVSFVNLNPDRALPKESIAAQDLAGREAARVERVRQFDIRQARADLHDRLKERQFQWQRAYQGSTLDVKREALKLRQAASGTDQKTAEAALKYATAEVRSKRMATDVGKYSDAQAEQDFEDAVHFYLDEHRKFSPQAGTGSTGKHGSWGPGFSLIPEPYRTAARKMRRRLLAEHVSPDDADAQVAAALEAKNVRW